MNRTEHRALAYTVPEAMHISGHGRTKLYELFATGRVRAMKAGRRTLVCAESLRRYLADLPAMSTKR